MYVKGGKNGDTWRSPKTEELQICTPGSAKKNPCCLYSNEIFYIHSSTYLMSRLRISNRERILKKKAV